MATDYGLTTALSGFLDQEIKSYKTTRDANYDANASANGKSKKSRVKTWYGDGTVYI